MINKQNIDLKFIEELYTSSLAEHGVTAKGVGWPDAQSHMLRFDKLACLLDGVSEPVSVNDLGCGYGAFYTYLRSKDVPISLFRGYDISETMLDEARRQINAAAVQWINEPVLNQKADYSFASGIFNVRQDKDEESWREYIISTLDNMDKNSERGFAFNLLTSYVDWQEPHLFYGNPGFFFDYCKRTYSRHVSLLHDYPLWEWTIIVRKQPSQS